MVPIDEDTTDFSITDDTDPITHFELTMFN